ncbi:ABC transporter ATP-binding protein/permease [Cereibacter azotoformans]|uniref:ATP-binding cassette subfamily B protein n=2 Tax=Cereibacter TaxID=1653176 RepID=A0A2T5KAY6_9RHOB|nr:ABC transporter ATP-binding protein [Cereibacter azotoformans]AXQ93925.1 ABC transporter ATP-binding protein [Cereibacter sphaeroides]MBO4168264.1 ABC transporter ATP-binding protein [Cereibacter azotoformans]PTR19578.1 ATP-binding cassette subfamily B protein [Cereibacter azotoformans]UIJ29443.1 ABC transporter ATP-binding protein/permease [Cereibacter azotoformans]ULB10156.1 ABC transporter ATP-binding protein/permease [Cereibacter azotoformans]
MPRTPDDPRYTSGRLFGRLWTGYLRRHTGTMALAFLLNVIEGSTLGALSWLIQPLFDQVFAPGGNRLLLWVGLAILGLFVLRGATSIASKALLTRVSQISSTAMQVDLLRHILTLDQGFFQKNPPGALMERVQGDTTAVQGVWSSVILGMGRDVVSLIGLFTVALLIDPVWTLAALVGAPILILPAVVVQRYIRRKTQQMRVQAGERSTRLDEIFHGIQPIKLNRMEGYQLTRFRRISDLIVRGQLKMAVGRAAMPALIDVITGIGFFAVLMLGGREIAAGERTTGEFMSFFTAMALTFQPLRRLGDLSGFWQIAAASLERIYRLFDTEPEVIRRPATAAPKPGTPDIRLENVHFSYDGHPVLNGLTLRAAPGRMTALVGPSGAGKSTVFHLLTGLIEPGAGRVLINGVDAADMDLADLRAQFAVVSQEAGLFDETIRENVTLGRDVPEDRLRASLEAAHVTDFMDLLPEGDLTPAGPRGSRLSGGQRQRVAIARALVSDAPVLLLDEATSALDAASEALVAEALARLGEGRTTLVIAHRLSTVRQADRIVVMEAGRVADEGTHEELLARGGLYAELHRLQFRNGETDAG